MSHTRTYTHTRTHTRGRTLYQCVMLTHASHTHTPRTAYTFTYTDTHINTHTNIPQANKYHTQGQTYNTQTDTLTYTHTHIHIPTTIYDGCVLFAYYTRSLMYVMQCTSCTSYSVRYVHRTVYAVHGYTVHVYVIDVRVQSIYKLCGIEMSLYVVYVVSLYMV